MSPLAIALLLVLATVAHLLFWRWKLAAPGREDERLHPATADGWRLCLGRRRPRGDRRGPPVLLVPGIVMNRLAMDFGVERHSLAAHLAAGGLDCFSLDLRGHGGARRGPGAPRDWTLDDYLALDVPAALDAIAAATGARAVLWVGHSQGALLGLAAASRFPDRIAGVVALAPPVRLGPAAAALPHLPLLARLRVVRTGARLLAPATGRWQPRRADAILRLAEMEPAVYRRMMMNAIERPPVGVVDQFERLAREDRLGSLDGREDWFAALAACRQPALFVDAPEDGLAPPAVVAEGFATWGGEKARFTAPAGVGHTDLLLGRRAPEVLFPVVREWLVAHGDAADQ